MSNENFRRELNDVIDQIRGTPSASLRDRVRSSLADKPELKGPYWIAAVAAFLLAAIIVSLMFVANSQNRRPSPIGPAPTPTSTSTPTSGALPSARSNAALAFDAATGKLVLFGGNVPSNGRGPLPFSEPFNDTWSWNGTRWTREATNSGLVARTQAAVAYDPVRRVVVMHGGFLADGRLVNETWTWDGTNWTLKNPSQTPPDVTSGANGASSGGRQPMCWDSAHGVAVLFDATARSAYWNLGTSGVEPNQTWTWDGSNWQQLSTLGAPSGHGSGPASLVCPSAPNPIVFFGHVNGTPTTWTFDGAAWTQASTIGSASLDFAMAPDDARRTVVLFGQNGDTWTWNGTTWTPQNPAHSPSPRQATSMAYDSAHEVVVLFGGATKDTAGHDLELNDTWIWNGSDWTQVA